MSPSEPGSQRVQPTETGSSVTRGRSLVPPTAVVATLYKHWSLVYQLTRRNVVGRYRGSVLGLAWSLFYPVLMLSVYTFVFGVVFRSRWSSTEQSTWEFATVLFVGIIVHGFFAECIVRSSGLIVGNSQYVKKVVFPLEILPWVTVFSALFHASISILVLLVFYLLVSATLHWTVILVPAVLLPMVILAAGVSWCISSIAVYVRDVSHIVGVIATVLLFTSPIFYPIEALPEAIRPYVYLNPLSFIVEQMRNVVIWGRLPDWIGLLIYLLIGSAAAWLSVIWFRKLRPGFADVV